ncbi:GGDEF domain-containing protein [Candidatus Igneacidithiobacillus taiwanensis]|uniref:GGDEF domain-containing protein n=1 Tax=Candidatus Igneacidithiobacillus taiwanensis TaxID=1945924 RepID=UPI00289E226B|nr:GGDEF domain-containing protein [Candidatus Igneacidithiobacillus taiwanensis]MCE5359609.1 GGDEF domain-containing protein [Acidithiobacillus sp.]
MKRPNNTDLQALLEALLAAWEQLWEQWLLGNDTRPAAARLNHALHAAETQIPDTEKTYWSNLQEQCHFLMHELQALGPSIFRQDEAWQIGYRRVVTGATHFQRQCRQGILRQQAYKGEVDSLTRVPGRSRFQRELARELARVQRGEKACLAMIDLDHFKTFNDQYGHLGGDHALFSLCRFLEQSLRPYDQVYRFGGEEFAILFPGMTAEWAETSANRLCRRLADNEFRLDDGRPYRLTMSMGIVQLNAGQSPEENLELADQALYRAKAEGRNRAIFIGPSSFTHAQEAVSFR